MIKFYLNYFCKVCCLLAIMASGIHASAFEATARIDTNKLKSGKATGAKITDTRKDKPSFLNKGVKINFVPFKPTEIKAAVPATTAGAPKNNPVQDNKVLTNVKVYPNPVEDEINFSYHISRESNVTIKIMDVLGNPITTLLSQKLPAGEQLNTFNVASKLNSGIYFVRIMVGNEPIVKRISVL